MLVFRDLKTDARKGRFWNGCTQGSSWAPMRATRNAILTDARNGLLGNGCCKVWGKSRMRATYIPDARNPFNQRKHRPKRGGVNCQILWGRDVEMSWRDVTSDSWLKLSTNFPCLPRKTGKGRALKIDPRRVEANCLLMKKKNYQKNTCRRRYHIETENGELWSIQGSN